MPGEEERKSGKPAPGGKARKYWKLFSSTFMLSACTFGGGFVIIPLMRRKFVDELHWIGEQEMLDLTAIAQSSPGAIAVNASILIGYRVAGPAGALLTVLGTVTPPLVIISLVSMFYTAVRGSRTADRIMAGMLAGVGAVVCDVVVTMTQGLLKTKRVLPFVMLIASFAAVRFFGVGIVTVILACGLIGAADTIYRNRAAKERLRFAKGGTEGKEGSEHDLS